MFSRRRESPAILVGHGVRCLIAPPQKRRSVDTEGPPPGLGAAAAEVHFIAIGTCTIVASVEETSDYEAAETGVSFTVSESNEQKLAKAIKVCKRDGSKSKRKRCETAAPQGYKVRAEREAEDEKKQEGEEKANREAKAKTKQEEELAAKREQAKREAEEEKVAFSFDLGQGAGLAWLDRPIVVRLA